MLRRITGLGVLAVCVFTLAPAPDANAAPCAGFTDVDDTSAFCPNVEWMKNRGITLGCAPGLYCPSDPVSRLAMAAFMNRLGTYLPPTLVDSTGKAFATTSLPMNSNISTILVYGLFRYQGIVTMVTMRFVDFTVPRWDYAPELLFFELPNCSTAGSVWQSYSSMFTPRQGGVVFDSEPGTPGSRWLYVSPPFSVPTTHAYQSDYVNGVCSNVSGAINSLVEAERVVDLTTLWTAPFTIQ
jgi:hypothetical protein